MANSSVVYARINSEIKQGGEAVLAELGISPSSAIQMFYRQLMTDHALPFTPHTAPRRPLTIADLTREQLNAEIRHGLDSLENGQGISEDEADAILAAEFGI